MARKRDLKKSLRIRVELLVRGLFLADSIPRAVPQAKGMGGGGGGGIHSGVGRGERRRHAPSSCLAGRGTSTSTNASTSTVKLARHRGLDAGVDGVEGACGLRVDAHVAHAVVREGPGRLGEVGVPVEGAGAWWLGTQEAAADGKEAKRSGCATPTM